jgi:sterol desaturase/sphingolipid hydroxylase (fatty acid hydroxylase superfamily)
MEKVIAAVLVVIFTIAILAGVYGAVWWLWCAVFGYLWPSGPAQIIHPDFWMFVGAGILISLGFKSSITVKKEK